MGYTKHFSGIFWMVRMTPLSGVMFGSARAKQDQRRLGLLAEERRVSLG